jgi:peroxiredoxin
MQFRKATIVLLGVVVCLASGCSQPVKHTTFKADDRTVETSGPAVRSPGSASANQPHAQAESPRKLETESDKDQKESEIGEPSFDARSPRAALRERPTIRLATMPEVVLTQQHARDSFVRVGDELPEFELPDQLGRMHAMGDVQGTGLTVVAFWSSDRLQSGNMLRFIEERIGSYADLGVKVVAVNVGDAPERVQKATGEAGFTSPVLLDVERRFYSRVGQGHLPRVYLLDRERRILWFDIEFSRETREQLEQAIQASLKST